MYDAAVQIPLGGAVLLLVVPALILEWRNKKPARHKDAILTKHLMLWLMACNTLNQMIYIVKWLFCLHCGYLFGAVYISRALVKGTNLLFLVHRAKLSQRMAPILSRKWFEKILPSMIVGLVIIFIVLIINSLMDIHFVCKPYADWDSLSICTRETADSVNEDASGQFVAALAIAVDLGITIFLMVLFVVPLYKVYHLDLGEMSPHQLKQRAVLKNLLLWSLPLTFINQVTSTLLLVPVVHSSRLTKTLYMIGQFDPPINIWTSWLMVTRNRQYLRRILRSICGYKSTPTPSLKRGFTRRGSTVLMDAQEIMKNVNRLASANPVRLTERQTKQSTDLSLGQQLSSNAEQTSDRMSELDTSEFPRKEVSN